MKILFLDFDGVLNTENCQVQLRKEGRTGRDCDGPLFDPNAVRNLKRILYAVPDVRIVIESSWKIEGLGQLRRMWERRGLPGRIHDVTPDVMSEELLTLDLSDPDIMSKLEDLGKGREISKWMEEHAEGECQYAILDDLPEFSGELAAHHVLVRPDVGITAADADMVIRMLEDPAPETNRHPRRRYMNAAHEKQSETLQKAVDKMMKHPLSYEEMKAQCDRNRAALEKKHAASSLPAEKKDHGK